MLKETSVGFISGTLKLWIVLVPVSEQAWGFGGVSERKNKNTDIQPCYSVTDGTRCRRRTLQGFSFKTQQTASVYACVQLFE